MKENEEKLTLWQLQDKLFEYEELINQDDIDLYEILGEISEKIDNIKQMIDLFETEADRFKHYKDEMAARQKSLQNASERLKSYVISCLENHNSTFEKGNIWVAKIRENKRIETFKEPEAKDMLKLAKSNIFCIKSKYEWDKSLLKEMISNPDHDPIIDDYAKITISKSINFTTINIASKKGKTNE